MAWRPELSRALWGLSAALLAAAVGTVAGASTGKLAGVEIKQPFSYWWRYRTSPAATLREARAAALAAAAAIAGISLFTVVGLASLMHSVPAGVIAGVLALGITNVRYCRNPATAAWSQ